jgi:aminopeptidase-like protein
MYEAVIDATLEDGSLTYGECYIPGESEEEVLISCHVCHPSLCNDNLSGIVVATYLAKELAKQQNRYSYRILFVPGTIGSITWLSQNEDKVPNIKHGLVATLLGDSAGFTYKKSREGDFMIDRAMEHVLKHSNEAYQIIDFFPYGYDERQYCSPGFNMPVGCIMRSQHGEFPEYHTSADNLDFVKASSLEASLGLLRNVVTVLEKDRRYLNTNPKCEPQLGKRGLYESLVGSSDKKSKEMAMFWILNLSDGRYSLLDIAERSKIPFATIQEVADLLREHDLLVPVPDALI